MLIEYLWITVKRSGKSALTFFFCFREKYIKEKNTDELSFGSSFNWNFFLYHLTVSKETLRYPGILTHPEHDLAAIYKKTATNIKQI